MQTGYKTSELKTSAIPSELEKLAIKVVGQPYYDHLLDFFTDVFSRDAWIAFVTRRCSCLGCLFMQILKVKHVLCLTDSALIDSGYFIGTKLPTGQAPEILLVDDSIAYGRAARSILESFLDRITEGFDKVGGDKNAQEYLSPLEYVQSKVEIFVFAQKRQQFVLPSFYHRRVYCHENYSNTEWNEVSNRFAELINVSNIANAAFVLSGGTTQEPKENVSNSSWVHTKSNYYGLEQHVWFKMAYVHGRPAAICSVRRVQCDNGGDSVPYYRYIPFMFLPSLNVKQLDVIEDILNGSIPKMKMAGTLENMKVFLEDATPRKRMEFLTLCLSHSVLRSFADEFGITPEEFDDEKIAWNYTGIGDQNKTAEKFLNALCNDECLVPYESLLDRLSEISPLVLPNSVRLEPDTDERTLSYAQESLERHLFELSAKAEQHAHDCIERRSRAGSATLDYLDEMRCESLFDFVESLQTKFRNTSTIDWLTCILQMMDCGAMSIVISAESDRIDQQTRICEQAPFLLMRRYFCYLDVLKQMDKYKSAPMVRKRAYVEHFVAHMEEPNRQKVGQILFLILSLIHDSSQSMDDFDIRLYRHFVINKECPQAQWDFESEDQQKEERLKYAQLWAARHNS